MATVDQRLNNLEHLVNYILFTIDKDEINNDGQFINMSGENASQNEGITENDESICDIAEMSDMNSFAIDDLAEMIDDLEQRVTALEEKNNG